MGYSLEINDNNSAPTYTHVKKVGIIGAGVAGLQLAERLTKVDGIEVTIFESTGKVGGVWSSNYADFGLQVPKELYEFPSFPYPEHKQWAQFPKGPQVQEYIENFAAHFDLTRLIKFNTSVLAAKPLSAGGWSVTFATDGGTAPAITEAFDFVVVATGMYSGACPHMPAHPGRETFAGEVLHSHGFTRREQAAGKRVVVVGGGKSAVDCAVAAVKGGAKNVTLLYREAHWPVPRRILDLIPFQWATYSRFGHALLPTHHDVSPLAWWMHCLLTPLKWLMWRLVELIFAWQFRLEGEMRPTTRIEIDVFTGGQILTYEARDMIRSGQLTARKGAIARYTSDGVELATEGRSIGADLVVYGTGFVKSYDYLDADVQAKLRLRRDGLYLYRSLLPVSVPGIAFLGSEVSTFNNVLTHALQAAWLSRLLTGAMALPPPRQMQAAVDAEMSWKRMWMPSTSARAAIQQLHMPKYHDRLMADMGEATCRKSNPLFEMLVPYNARDYRALFGLPDRTTWMRLKSAIVLAALLLPTLLEPEGEQLILWLVAAAVCAGVHLLPEETPRSVAFAESLLRPLAPRSAERAAMRMPAAAPRSPRSPRHTTLAPARYAPSRECHEVVPVGFVFEERAAKPIKRE